MRTSEIDGLKWQYVDFERRQIHIRETLVKGNLGTTKTEYSQRTIEMSSLVFAALKAQHEVSGKISQFVFVHETEHHFSTVMSATEFGTRCSET